MLPITSLRGGAVDGADAQSLKSLVLRSIVGSILIMSTMELLVDELKTLAPDKLALAAHYISGLREFSQEDRSLPSMRQVVPSLLRRLMS